MRVRLYVIWAKVNSNDFFFCSGVELADATRSFDTQSGLDKGLAGRCPDPFKESRREAGQTDRIALFGWPYH
jgi:hypothetical protein